MAWLFTSEVLDKTVSNKNAAETTVFHVISAAFFTSGERYERALFHVLLKVFQRTT